MATVVEDFPNLSQQEVAEHAVMDGAPQDALTATATSNPSVVQEWLRRDQRNQIYLQGCTES